MPKIEAATVAEHHAQRRRALLDAAAALLADGGVSAVTPAAAGARAGLARSSVYQYFDSTAALIAAVVEDTVPQATAVLQAAVAAANTPAGQIDAYIRAAIDLAAQGIHRPAAALAAADLPGPCRARLQQLHTEQLEPLRRALAQAHAADADLLAALLTGLIFAAMQAVEAGSPPAQVAEHAARLARHGLGIGPPPLLEPVLGDIPPPSTDSPGPGR